MKHFIYKTISPSGKFYISRHSTNNIDDGYLGSGKWIRSIRNKSVGFGSGEYNYMKDPKNARRISKKRIANGNHKYSEKTKKHLSKVRTGYKTGKPAWNTGLTKEDSEIIRKASEKVSKSISKQWAKLTEEERKEKFGNSGKSNGFYNKHHSEETKKYLGECRKAEKWICEHCGKAGTGNGNYARYHGDKCKDKV